MRKLSIALLLSLVLLAAVGGTALADIKPPACNVQEFLDHAPQVALDAVGCGIG